MSASSDLRINIMRYIFTLIAFLFLVQIIHLMIIGPDEAWEMYSAGYEEKIPPTRGIIYDRNGNPLATNQTLYTVTISPEQVYFMDNTEDIANALSRILGMPRGDIYDVAYIASEEESYEPYRIVGKFIEQDLIDQIAFTKDEYEGLKSTRRNPAPSLYGVYWEPFLVRSYPNGDLATNILGTMTKHGDVFNGLEKKYDDLLSGVPTTILETNQPNLVDDEDWPEGSSLILTIDREIQRTVEEILQYHIDKTKALSGTIIVSDPETGDVLAMATNVENKLEWTKNDSRVAYPNPAVEDVYEPGSVSKVLTMAAAIDSGVVTPDSPFFDPGYYQVGGVTVSNWDRNAYGSVTMTECMQYSLNVCLAYVADQLGYEKFYTYLDAFNIGHLSGIDLSGEQVFPLNAAVDLSNLAGNSFGQGMNVTPIQISTAISAVANDGIIMTPRIVRSVISDGRQYELPTKVIGQPISAETARTVTEMLAESLEGEAEVYVPGYRMAGKTGTAEIWPYKEHPDYEKQTYRSDAYNASFVGWGPVEDPQFLVYIWLEEPVGEYWGSLVAAPVFSDVARELVVLMDIPPDDVRIQLADDPMRLKQSVNTE
jgi:cell division protein FtsI/penicillin-binding protein 2